MAREGLIPVRVYIYRGSNPKAVYGFHGSGLTAEAAFIVAKSVGMKQAHKHNGYITILPEGITHWGVGDNGSLYWDGPESTLQEQPTYMHWDRKQKAWVSGIK